RGMRIIAPIPIVVHLFAYLAVAGKPYYAAVMVGTTACMVFTVLPLLIMLGGPTLRQLPAWQRKHFFTVWIGHLVAMAVMLLVVVLAAWGNKPETLLMVYPLWAASAAMSFLAHATEAGMYYMVAAIIFGVAILMAFTPYAAPLELAFFMTANMTVQAIYLGNLTQEPAGAGGALRVASATTIKSDGEQRALA